RPAHARRRRAAGLRAQPADRGRQDRGAAEDRRLAAQGPQGRGLEPEGLRRARDAQGAAEVKTAIRKHAAHFGAVIGLAVIAAIVGGYIMHNQRMRFPWEGKPFQLQASFSTAQAVTPGQGQTVRVSGVRVGDITKVGLKDGKAVVTLSLDPQYKDFVRTDATALLRPKTGLKDMFIELDPGTDKAPLAKKGWTLPVSSTLP